MRKGNEMPIFHDIPQEFYRCKDGTYSDHARRGACNWHGGLESPEPIERCQTGPHGQDTGVFLVPLDDLHTNEEWFQNRAQAFSTRSVENIVNAYLDGKFQWAQFDPITAWHNPADGRLYIISGHSRTEAFRRLCAMGASVDGRSFCEIPTKIVRGISLEEAQRLAMESNTLATPETDIERARYYRRMREQGVPESQIKADAKRMEGRNA
ncbi:MAG: hypothetical protein D6816_13050, partial [Bacteroidetes bacterium]